MKKGGVGGATTQTGLRFENKVDFQTLISAIPGYSIREHRRQGLRPRKNRDFVSEAAKRLGTVLGLDPKSAAHKSFTLTGETGSNTRVQVGIALHEGELCVGG